jgi:hypothetical protein
MGVVIISDMNPIKFVKKDLIGSDLQKLSDRYNFIDTIKTTETKVSYKQKWIKGNLINLQFWLQDIDSFELILSDCSGVPIQTIASLNTLNAYLIQNFIYNIPQYSIDTSTLAVGDYYFIIKFKQIGNANFDYLISEPQQILNELDNALLFKYSNELNDYNVIFKTELYVNWLQEFYFLVEGGIYNSSPFVQEEVFEDQDKNKKLLDARPYEQFEFIVGNQYGVPVWVGNKLNFIRSCDKIIVDNYQFTFEGNFEKNSFQSYPLFEYKAKSYLTNYIYAQEFGTQNVSLVCEVPVLTVTPTVGGVDISWTVSQLNGFGFNYILTQVVGMTEIPVSNGQVFSLNLSFNTLVTGLTYSISVQSLCVGGTFSNYSNQVFVAL